MILKIQKQKIPKKKLKTQIHQVNQLKPQNHQILQQIPVVILKCQVTITVLNRQVVVQAVAQVVVRVLHRHIATSSHSHSYSSKTVKATCTSDGYTVHTCSCGASYTDNYTSATGHRWSEWKTVKKATTSSEGRKQRTCSSCGKTESKTIAKVKSPSGGSSSSGGHKITGARKAVYSYRGMDSFSSVNLVDLINAERAKEGLGKLEWTADLLQQDYNEEPWTFDSGYFDSNGNFDPYRGAEIREPLEGVQKMADMGYATHGNGVGCHCVGASEGASTIEEALRRQIKAYINSPEHRAILMNAGSHSVTAAYAIDSNGTVYTAILVGG